MAHYLIPRRTPRPPARAAAAFTALALAAVAAGAAAAPAHAAAVSTATLVVEANEPFRTATHVADGALYGLDTATDPANSLVSALHPSSFVQMAPGGQQLPNGETTPGGDALVVAPEAAKAGAKVIVRMPDWYPNFPYKWVSWSNWLSAIDTQVAAVKASGDSDIQAMEIWNEPDWTWDTSAAGSFDAGWVESYNEIRKDDATIPIEGPSYSAWNESWMSSFLTYAKANNALPQYLSWHELSGDQNIAADVAACEALEASLGISPIPIVIEEYGETGEVGVPGSLVGYIAKFERAGVDEADLAFWNEYGTLGDTLVSTGGATNGAYWLYDWYGAMTGNMVTTVPPAQTGVDGAASVNAAGNQVSVIFGGGSGPTDVTVNGLGSLSAFGSSVNVTLQYTPGYGRTTAVAAPSTVYEGTYTVSNGSITVPVAMNAAAGYHLVITPSGASTASLAGTYKIKNVNSGLALDTQGSGTAQGTLVDQATADSSSTQSWTLVSAGDGLYKIENAGSGLLLGIDDESTADGGTALIWGDNGTSDHLWQLIPVGSGEYELVNDNSGLVLGVTDESASSGAQVLQWADNGTPDHLWTLTAQ
jgi:hypothetical protein